MAQNFEDFLKGLKEESTKALQKKTLAWYMQQVKKIVTSGIPFSPPKTASTLDLEKLALDIQKITSRKTTIFPSATLKKYSDTVQDSMTWNIVGKMLMYVYDPKLKKTLPYYDKFPLIFMIKSDGDHTLGLNMHYLPPYERAKLMGALYNLINNRDMDEQTRLNITYQTLKGSSRYRLFKPCIKSYLSDHIRSKVYIIDPKEWNNVLLLPLANFQKESEFKVWQSSLESLKK